MRTTPTHLRSFALLLGLAGVLSTLSACGTKGPLTLPPPPAVKTTPATPATPAKPAAGDATTATPPAPAAPTAR